MRHCTGGKPSHPHPLPVSPGGERNGGRERAATRGGAGGGVARAPNPLLSPAPSPPPVSFLPTERCGERCPSGCDSPPLFFLPFLSFFFPPFPIFVNERKRSGAVPGTAALGVSAATSSERARRGSGGLAPHSSAARRLQPAQAEDRRTQPPEVGAAARSPAPARLHDIGHPGRGEMLIRKRRRLQWRARGRSRPAVRPELLRASV